MKTDRRTKYTKMVIREAFLTLMKSKDFHKITISDICNFAEISRPTFYLHYQDIYALLNEIVEDLIASANLHEFSKLTIDKQNEIHYIIVKLIKLIENNIDIYRICVLERRISTPFPKLISNELNQTLIKYWTDQKKLNDKLDKNYVIEFIQASFNSIILCWINKKECRESVDELASIIETFLVQGLFGFVN